MDTEKIAVSTPVNKLAAVSVGQKNITTGTLGRKEINERIKYLQKRTSELKSSVGVRSRTHYKNLKYRTSKCTQPEIVEKNEEVFNEIFDIGQEIERLKNVIFEMRINNFKNRIGK
jgi:hypothetical protein